jgi:hypothetical protein
MTDLDSVAQLLASAEATIAGLREGLAQTRSAAQIAKARMAEQARQVEEWQRQAQQRDSVLAQTAWPRWSRPGSPLRSPRSSGSSKHGMEARWVREAAAVAATALLRTP